MIGATDSWGLEWEMRRHLEASGEKALKVFKVGGQCSRNIDYLQTNSEDGNLVSG